MKATDLLWAKTLLTLPDHSARRSSGRRGVLSTDVTAMRNYPDDGFSNNTATQFFDRFPSMVP
jgi:hypothetical protein